MPENNIDLISHELHPLLAIKEKLRRGVVKHGDEWVGHPPLIEAHDEALDLGAYLIVAIGRSDSPSEIRMLEELLDRTIVMIKRLRQVIIIKEEHDNES